MRRSDTGPFAITPAWVLDADVSDRAVRLYAVLARYADSDTGECWPARRTLWERLGCSERSLDRAMKELVAIQAIECVERIEAGARTTNLYTVRRLDPTDEVASPVTHVGAPVTPGVASRVTRQ